MSYYSRIKNRVCSILYNHLDKHIGKHIIVIESDDWGSIRVASRKAYDALIGEGYAMTMRPYERYDCLETDEDIKALSQVLIKYRDSKGNHPIITMNYLSANPDFAKVKKDGYMKYSFKTIEQIYQETEGTSNVISLVKKGIEEGIFRPQCHGREHFNVLEWLKALQSGNRDVLMAFKHGMCGIFPKEKPSIGNQYMVALRYRDESSQDYVCQSIEQALDLFRKTWGYSSRTFIAPCYTWSDKIEQVLSENGVKFLQGVRVRRSSYDGSRMYCYAGQVRNGLVQGIRNCSFEPSTSPNFQIQDLMNEIDKVFKTKKVAVISSHRINYVSGIDINNRTESLQLLDQFLEEVLHKYPDVEFMSSDQLINEYI